MTLAEFDVAEVAHAKGLEIVHEIDPDAKTLVGEG